MGKVVWGVVAMIDEVSRRKIADLRANIKELRTVVWQHEEQIETLKRVMMILDRSVDPSENKTKK